MARNPLTRREQQILALVAVGHTNKEIASRLGISPRTVQAHVAAIMGKFGVQTRTAAVWAARERGGSSGHEAGQ